MRLRLCDEVLEITQDDLGVRIIQVINLPITDDGIEDAPTTIVTNK